jgi:hypothetical protein
MRLIENKKENIRSKSQAIMLNMNELYSPTKRQKLVDFSHMTPIFDANI